MTDPNNGKVTLAVIGEKMDNVEQLLREHLKDCKVTVKNYDVRIRSNELKMASLDQRIGVTTGILGTLQILGMGIATWLGLKG